MLVVGFFFFFFFKMNEVASERLSCPHFEPLLCSPLQDVITNVSSARDRGLLEIIRRRFMILTTVSFSGGPVPNGVRGGGL